MDKKYLLESANQLKQVGDHVSEEYINKSEQLIANINSVMLERPDIEKLVGTENFEMMKDNHANHVRFIGSVLKNYNPEVMVDTVLWVFRAYQSHGFRSNYWAAQLNAWLLILKETLTPETFDAVYPYYEWMQVNIPLFVEISDGSVESNEYKAIRNA